MKGLENNGKKHTNKDCYGFYDSWNYCNYWIRAHIYI